MPEQKPRAYEVLQRAQSGAYLHRGVVSAHSADAAIEEVAEHCEEPGRYVAVPQNNWNERDVEVEQIPRVAVKPVGADPSPEAPETLPIGE